MEPEIYRENGKPFAEQGYVRSTHHLPMNAGGPTLRSDEKLAVQDDAQQRGVGVQPTAELSISLTAAYCAERT